MSLLDDVLASTRARVDEAKRVLTPDVLEQRIASAEAPRGFRAALAGEGTAIVAEVKRASPAAGPLDIDLDAAALARAYARGGAAAISVLTEPRYFRGSLDDLAAARGAGVPVLLKDFVVDEFQVLEARAAGADAILVIVRVLERDDDLRALVAAAGALRMDALVEVHDERDLERAAAAGADLVGVNHRDLATFEVDPARTARLAPHVAAGAVLVALSGVSSRADVERLAAAGAHAVLVGESVVTAPDPGAKVAELAGRA
ncbi:MAG TPA: indole-3-glycerol phosphate synthase TrpC [Actinomycetota bacterium]|nr:indole-3-glycerol phosphate synthase TrpC [Actinomycetota bacterium]